nr:PREDICTED: regulator of G-protein signaling 1-like [Equus przewalskii]
MNECLNELGYYIYHYGGCKVKQITDDAIKELTAQWKEETGILYSHIPTTQDGIYETDYARCLKPLQDLGNSHSSLSPTINIDFSTRDLISKNIAEPTLKCFDEAQKLIYSLMAKDSFPRFLKSEIYKKLVNSKQVGNHKKWLPFL